MLERPTAQIIGDGVLFRDQEEVIRKGVIEGDLIEAVIGLGPNLFYNSPLESCIVMLRQNKTDDCNRRPDYPPLQSRRHHWPQTTN